MKKIVFLKHLLFLLILAVVTAGCNKQPNSGYDENAAKEKFCLYLNEENIDQTIPIVNEYISMLDDDLDDEQQLQKLVTWLQSCPCIIDANIVDDVLYMGLLLPIYQITFSFDENGMTKNLIMNILKNQPLKVANNHEGPTRGIRIAYIHLQEITEDNLIYDVYTMSSFFEVIEEYIEEKTENNIIKIDIFSSYSYLVDCTCPSKSTISIKKGAYQKAIISAMARCESAPIPEYFEYRLIGTIEIFLPKTK